MLRKLNESLTILIVSIVALSSCPGLFAEELPRLELGIGVTSIHLPDYRGSSEQRNYLLPLPFVIYRGENLRADRDGIRGLLFKHPRMALDVSIGGYVPVDSADNPQREGMSDLDPTLEVGPSLNFHLSDLGARGPRIRLPLRAVVSVGGDGTSHVGWRLNPVYELPFEDRLAGFAVKMQFGPQFADRAYHDHFYSVAGVDARPSRPAFAASGGYSGLSLQFSATRRLSNHWWLGAFLRYDDLRGAAFEDSPLAIDDEALLFGIGFARIFYRSESVVSQQ